MARKRPEHTLEFLLDFDGRVHWYAGGYWVKFEIGRVDKTKERPHGLSYSFTLHGPDNKRLVGFDNAHSVAPLGGRFNQRSATTDHWHCGESDRKPRSIAELAEMTGHKPPNVTRTLGKLEAVGFVRMKTVKHRKVPTAAVRAFRISIDPFSQNDRLEFA